MNIIYGRWARAGYLPSWFYAVLGSGFVALTIMAAVRSEWLLAVLSLLMVAVTIAAARYMPRLARAAEESTQRFYPDTQDRGSR